MGAVRQSAAPPHLSVFVNSCRAVKSPSPGGADTLALGPYNLVTAFPEVELCVLKLPFILGSMSLKFISHPAPLTMSLYVGGPIIHTGRCKKVLLRNA